MPGFLEMSDEDFAKQGPPAVVQEEQVQKEAAPAGAVSTEEPVTPVEQVAEETTSDTAPVEKTEPVEEQLTDAEQIASGPPAVQTQETKPPAAPAPDNVATAPAVATPATSPAPAPAESKEVDYEAFYKQMTAPFKANGKTIQMHTPDEVLQLMRMGANYTQKMQTLAPQRKILMMLENNGLLDESRLSYLIDLDKKNPEAVKKLIKDSGIDPLTIDTTVEPAYRAGSHGISDDEFGFRNVLDELTSTEEGKKTVQRINTDWDQASKELLWKDPAVMTTIHQQVENGIYELISTEVDRQKTLGAIAPTVPFIHAYKAVGDVMQRQGAFNAIAATAKQPPTSSTQLAQVKQPLAVKAATPKPQVTNSSQAAAASQQRATPKPAAGTPINPLAMSDEDFLKQMKNRV